MMRDQLSETVGDQVMDSMFSAQSVEEQRQIFQSMPQDKVEAIVRYVNTSQCIIQHYNFVCINHILFVFTLGIFSPYRALCDKNNLLKGRSAAQQKYLSDISQDFIADTLLTGFNRVSSEVSLKDNFYFNWICVGERGYNPESRPEFAPPYLREENFLALRVCHIVITVKTFLLSCMQGLVARVDVHTTSLEDYLSLPDIPLFNKVSLYENTATCCLTILMHCRSTSLTCLST